MNPKLDLLTKYSALAKSVIYDADRMRKFMGMLGTPDGAVIAVQTVLGAIEQAKPIPPEIAKSLGVNAYLIMVELAQDITGKQASPDKMKKVISLILDGVTKTHGQPAQPAPQPAPARGILAGAAQ